MCNLWKLTTSHLQPSSGRAGRSVDSVKRPTQTRRSARSFHTALRVAAAAAAAAEQMGGMTSPTFHLSLRLHNRLVQDLQKALKLLTVNQCRLRRPMSSFVQFALSITQEEEKQLQSRL